MGPRPTTGVSASHAPLERSGSSSGQSGEYGHWRSGLPLGGKWWGDSQETRGPVAISWGAGGRWCWAARGGALEGGSPIKNEGDPLGGTSWAERTCKGEDGVCPGSSRDSGDIGARGSWPHPRLHVQGPKGREQVGVPSRSPAAINGGTDRGRTQVRFWILLERSGRPMSPWPCPGGVDASKRSQKPGSVGWAGHNPSRTAGQGLGGTGPAGRPLSPRETPEASVLAICPRPSLTCAVAGVGRGGGPESYPPGFKLGDKKGPLSQEWAVATSGACAPPTTHCPRRRASFSLSLQGFQAPAVQSLALSGACRLPPILLGSAKWRRPGAIAS